jgi:hypothetical protein
MNSIKKYPLLILLLFITNYLFASEFSQTKEMRMSEGYFNSFYNEDDDAIYLEVTHLDSDFLYVSSLATGIGSNDIGLDRGQLGKQRILHFSKAGSKLLLVEDNLYYRSSSSNPAERKSVKEAFARSVLAGFPIVEENKGSYLINISEFIIRDAHGVANTLASKKQGNYSLDKNRSAMYMERTKNFPKNTEFEAILTFAGKAEGNEIWSVAANAAAITVRIHHSFIELPDNNYSPRVFDVRMGYFNISHFDYSAAIDEDMHKSFIARHRLEKKDPNAEKSEAKEPIVYYLDPGTPEPVRSALLDGARWWNQAFEAAGYTNAFQVKMLPEDVDPLDIRYNVVQWVHRSTRGWSYGGSVVDPRTGEIIKGHVSLGSLRVKQDYLIATGLLNPFATGEESEEAIQMALARLRQLSAHEIGHTLGLAHNYSASMDGRASVMDYPHPKIDIVDGKLDLTNAYDQKIGAWDKMAILYGYQDIAKADEAKMLADIVDLTYKDKGLSFISDSDARPKGSAHPRAHLWDNGSSAAKELSHIMEVRSIALNQFSEKAIRPGQSMASLEEALAPIYFLHRYQIEAAAKVLGGLNYSYAMRGDGQEVLSFISKEEQLEAFDALLLGLTPTELALNKSLIKLIPPKPMGSQRGRESMPSKVGMVFDPVAIASNASKMTLSFMLAPERANRLVDFKYRDDNQPGLELILNKLIDFCFTMEVNSGLEREISHLIIQNTIYEMMLLANDKRSNMEVAAISTHAIDKFYTKLSDLDHKGIHDDHAVLHYTMNLIEEFKKDPSSIVVPQMTKTPDGSPIGFDINCSTGLN